jgi:hypothetical protein
MLNAGTHVTTQQSGSSSHLLFKDDATGLWYNRTCVPSITLQHVWDSLPQPLSRVDLLVVDVEGAEHLVLAPPLPSPLPAFIYFEVSALRPHSLHALSTSLKGQDYQRVRWRSEVRVVGGEEIDDGAASSAAAPSHIEGDQLWVHGKAWRSAHDRAKIVRNETCRGSDLRLYDVRDGEGHSLF